MNAIIQALDAEQMEGKQIPAFKSGDTVVVQVKVKEGNRERLQAFEGVVIAKRNRGLNSAFTVRKISSGEGVERTFQTYSPTIGAIEVKRRGHVRRAKLYYLRELTGKKARIKEKISAQSDKPKKAAAKKATKKTAAKKPAAQEKPAAKDPQGEDTKQDE